MSNVEAIKKADNAPDRIWATINGMSTRYPDGSRQLIGGWQQDAGRSGAVEYVRASALEELQRENEILKNLIDGDNCADPDKIDALFRRAELAETEAKRLQVGVYVETLPRAHLIRVFAEDMNERNWDDKRLYIKQQAERITAALASAGEEHHAE